MRWFITILLLLNVWHVLGQLFNERYDLFDQGRPQTAWDIESSGDGAFILVQFSSARDTIAPGLFNTHAVVGLTKIDGITSDKIWDKRFAPAWYGVFPGWANCCDTLPGGGIVIGGTKQDTLQNTSVLLMVFDAQGDTVLTRDLSPPGQQWNAYSVKHSIDGGYIIVGQTDATGYLDGFAIKTDLLGNVEWRRTYGQPWPRTDGLVHVMAIPNGGYIMAGAKYPTDLTQQKWVQGTDASGSVEWEVLWPVQPVGQSVFVERGVDGMIIFAGNDAYAANNMEQRPYLAKLDPTNGDILWENNYGAIAEFHVLYTAKEAPNGDIIACGTTQELGDFQGVLLRTTATGDSLWMRKYSYQDDVIDPGPGQFYDVLPTSDGGFIATGETYGRFQAPYPPGYSRDAWVVKVDGDGCLVPGCGSVGISEQVTNLQDAISVFPNPVQQGGSVTVQLDLPQHLQGKNLQLSVVGGDGRLVSTVATNGASTLNLANLQLATGLYFLHISNGSSWLTGAKLVVE